MSRSQRHAPYHSHLANPRSDKYGKTVSHRRVRRQTKVAIAQDEEVLPLERELTNQYEWIFGKDGKHYYPEGETALWVNKPWQWRMK